MGLTIFLIVFFLILLYLSTRGWGYCGYRGYHYGPSWWYWGGPRYYTGRSLRTGSVGSGYHRGGGLHGGK